jgi:hypothetical protein
MARMDRFDVRDYTGLLQREKKFDKFRKGQAKKATAWLTDILEDYARKSRKTFQGKIKPGWQTLFKLGGNILAPGAGSLIGALTGAYNTIATDKAYSDLLSDVGAKVEVPSWAKGTFMEDYLKTNLLSGQATAKNILAGSKKSSLMSGGVGALLDTISAGKGFAKSQELTDRAYNEAFKKTPVGGKNEFISSKVLGMIPGMGMLEETTNPLIDLAGKKGVGGRLGSAALNATNFGIEDIISELSTPASYSQYAQRPLIEMLLGPKQETYVPELRPGDYKTRRR